MQKGTVLFSLVFILMILVSLGCTANAGSKTPATAPATATVAAPGTMPVSPSLPPVSTPGGILPAARSVPLPHGRPLLSDVYRAGSGNQLIRFDTVASGNVTFHVIYRGIPSGMDTCSNRYSVFLRGRSYNNQLFAGEPDTLHDDTATPRLTGPGEYTLAVTGCHDWTVEITNA